MATITGKLIIKSGKFADLPTLDAGEPAFTTDTQKVYIGTSGGNVLVGPSSGGSGTVTSITAGTGLTGGTITTSGTIAANFGTASGTVCQGNDSRLSDARTPVDTALSQAYIWVGNEDNNARPVAVSGAASMTFEGVVSLSPVVAVSSATGVDWTFRTASDTNAPSLNLTRRRASDANVTNGDTVGQLRFLERVGGVDLELTRIEAIASGGVAFSEIRMHASTDSDTLAEVARFSTEEVRLPGLNSPAGRRVLTTDTSGILRAESSLDVRPYLGVVSGDITSNTTVNSTTFVDVAGASFAVGAGESWTARFVLAITGNTNGMRFQLTGPSSPTSVTMICYGNTIGVTAFSTEIETAFGAPTGGTSIFAVTTTTENVMIIEVKVVNGANAGTVQLQAATVSGTNTSTIQGNRCWFNAQRIN